MRKSLISLLLLLAATPALAQTQTLPPNTVLGRTGITPGPATAIPFATLAPLLGIGNTIAVTVNNGTISGGSFTPVCGTNFLQFFTNGGAFTMTAPTADGSCDLLQINGASAGIVTFSGFTLGSSIGDVLDAISGHKFIIHVETINGTSTALIKALQ